MQVIPPRNLSNSELIRYAADVLAYQVDLPLSVQVELLRRFSALNPADTFPPKDPNQQELFPQ
jgi:hypothetical protein